MPNQTPGQTEAFVPTPPNAAPSAAGSGHAGQGPVSPDPIYKLTFPSASPAATSPAYAPPPLKVPTPSSQQPPPLAAQPAGGPQAAPLTTKVAVEPNSVWQKAVEYIPSSSVLFSAVVACYGVYKAWLKLRDIARVSITDIGIPHTGLYHYTGHPSTDQRIAQLMQSASAARDRNAPNDTILIHGSQHIDKIYIAKALASQLGLPLVRIDCDKLANSTGSIPPRLIGTIEGRIRSLMRKHDVESVVLLFDRIESLACVSASDFILALKKAMTDRSSKLRTHSILVGSLDESASAACSSEQKENLRSLSESFGTKLPVTPPQTAEDIFKLLVFRIESMVRYPDKGKPRNQDVQASLENYTLSEDDRVFLRTLSQAMPELAFNHVIRNLALKLRELSETTSTAPTGDIFKRFVLDFALESIKGGHPPRYNDSAYAPFDANAVVTEAFAARALGKAIIALGVQARGSTSYVCRERANLTGGRIKDLIAEAILLQVRQTSALYSVGAANPLESNISDVRKTADSLEAVTSAASELLSQLLPHSDKAGIDAQLAGQIKQGARRISEHLATPENKAAYDALVHKLAPGICDGKPVELTLGELEEALAAFNVAEAALAADPNTIFEQLRSRYENGAPTVRVSGSYR